MTTKKEQKIVINVIIALMGLYKISLEDLREK